MPIMPKRLADIAARARGEHPAPTQGKQPRKTRGGISLNATIQGPKDNAVFRALLNGRAEWQRYFHRKNPPRHPSPGPAALRALFDPLIQYAAQRALGPLSAVSLVPLINDGQKVPTSWFNTVRDHQTDGLINIEAKGAVGDGIADEAAAFNNAHAALPANGGIIYLPPPSSKYRIASEVAFTKPIHLMGAGREAVTIELNTVGSAIDAFSSTNSLTVTDLTIKTTTPLTTATSQAGIRFDGTVAANKIVIVERCKITGFNFAIFADGRSASGTAFNLDLVAVRDCILDISSNNPPTAPGNCLFASGAILATIEDSILNNNDRGDHCSYFIRNQSTIVRHCRLINTFGQSVAAVKWVGTEQNAVDAPGLAGIWIEDNEIDQCNMAANIHANEFAASLPVIQNISIRGNAVTNVRSTAPGDAAAFFISTTLASIKDIVFAFNTVDTVQLGVISVQASAGSVVERVTIMGEKWKNWGLLAPGTYTACSGTSTGTFANISVISLRADGSNVGRRAVDFGGSTVSRLQYIDIEEINVTSPVHYAQIVVQGFIATAVNYTVLSTDHFVQVDATIAPITISLPPAASMKGRTLVIKKRDATANTVTIDADAAEQIENALTLVLSARNQAAIITSDGANWWLDTPRFPIVATASLPAAGAAQDGLVLIEDAGVGDRNLVIYAQGQRFRIDGGAPF